MAGGAGVYEQIKGLVIIKGLQTPPLSHMKRYCCALKSFQYSLCPARQKCFNPILEPSQQYQDQKKVEHYPSQECLIRIQKLRSKVFQRLTIQGDPRKRKLLAQIEIQSYLLFCHMFVLQQMEVKHVFKLKTGF